MTGNRINSFGIHPLTSHRWDDFEKLFGPRGACGGCWCMYWKLTHSEFEKNKGDNNRAAMQKIVESGQRPGLIGYVDDEPAGWCAVAPRGSYPRLGRSRILKEIDDLPAWSIVCFFAAREHRNKGMTVKLLRGAIEYVKGQGGEILEGYPVEPKKEKMPPPFVYHGLYSAFIKAGFKECARRSETRPIMRYFIGSGLG